MLFYLLKKFLKTLWQRSSRGTSLKIKSSLIANLQPKPPQPQQPQRQANC